MASSNRTSSQRLIPQLPDELWLEVLSHLDWPTLWQTVRKVHPKLKTEVERMAIANLMPGISLALTYTLGSGSSHRWYDVRATTTLSFSNPNKHNPDFAFFAVTAVHPLNHRERGLEKWWTMCAQVLSPRLDWHVIHEDVMHIVRLRKLVAAENGALWCDWRELLSKWFRRQEMVAGSRESFPGNDVEG